MTDYRASVALVPSAHGAAGEDREKSLLRGLRDRIHGLLGARRLWFPILAADPSALSGVLLAGASDPGPVFVNGRQARVIGRTALGDMLDPGPFCRWENVVSLRADAARPRLAPVVQDKASALALELPEGREWTLYDAGGAILGTRAVAQAQQPRRPCRLRSLAAGLGAMLAPGGDVWSFYDLADDGFRLAGWRWDTGIVLEALAAAAMALGDADALAAARAIGDRLLAVRLKSPGCPGGFPEWVDIRYSESPTGLSQWVAPFNTAFIAAGLMRLAEASGNAAYAQAAREGLRQAVAWGLTPAGGLAGYYFEGSGTVRYLGQINDSGILPRGLALFPEEPWAAEAAARAAGYVLAKAASPDGHIGRAWWDPPRTGAAGPPLFPEWRRRPHHVVAKVFLRGQAWVLLGLTGALRLGAGKDAEHGARRLAGYVLSVQRPDGSWLYSQLQPELGACAKTTAALALALAEWSSLSGDQAAAEGARRALAALCAGQGPRHTPSALSGLPVDTSEEGCIVYFRNRPVVCAYAAALELLARLALGERS